MVQHPLCYPYLQAWRVGQDHARASEGKTGGFSCDAGGHPPFSYPHCHVFINHK